MQSSVLSVCHGFGVQQKYFHFGGPRLFLNHEQRLKFAKMMGIAQGVLDTFHLEIRGPVIVDDKLGAPRQKIPSAGSYD